MLSGPEVNQERDRLGISVAAHIATTLAMRAEHVRYGQPVPTVDELSALALRELVQRRGLDQQYQQQLVPQELVLAA
ncbi:MAG TPA: hypothetical protein VLI54_01775 [Bacillota bacterium]|nr:hypothetical protein [Bacillota bacterium]